MWKVLLSEVPDRVIFVNLTNENMKLKKFISKFGFEPFSRDGNEEAYVRVI